MAVPAEADTTDRLLGGRYRLEAILGQGGSATVYRARDESLGRSVAIKLFHATAVDDARQEGELTVLSALDHHALVSLYDAGVEHDSFGRASRFLVMALVTGVDLFTRNRSTPIAPRHIAEIGYDMAEALDYIHSQNVIHRDLKPSNILLVDYGDGSARARAKLTDFGVALAEDSERLTAQGATTGTAAYLSPEQASGTEVGPASDVYSLGLVLLECWTRHLEYPGSVVASAIARLSRDPVIPDELPELWQQLLAAMTARDPAERPVGHDLVHALKLVVIAESGRHKEDEAPLFDRENGEAFRSSMVHSDALDTLPDEALLRVTALAARLFSAPISVVSVNDHDRTWVKSYVADGMEHLAAEVDLEQAPVLQSEPVVIDDAMLDAGTASNPLVTGPLGLRFYVSVPLKRPDGRVIGTLCVLDVEPGTASESDLDSLNDLAALVVAQLEMRWESMRITGDVTGGGLQHSLRTSPTK